jgi:hypothetical protein
MASIATAVDKAYEQMEFSALADAPVDALQGISAADAQALKQAFGITTVRQLAENKYVKIAQAITLLAGPKS